MHQQSLESQSIKSQSPDLHSQQQIYLSVRKLFGVIYGIIGHNYSEFHSPTPAMFFIDLPTTQWVAEKMLEKQVLVTLFNQLLFYNTFAYFSKEISECHQGLEIDEKQKLVLFSEESKNGILLSIHQIYQAYLRSFKL